MKRMFLTSSVKHVIGDIAKHIGKVDGMRLVHIYTPIEFKINSDFIGENRNALTGAGFEVTDYTITGKDKKQIKKDLEKFDVIFISGGNQFYLLQKIRETGCGKVLKDMVEKREKIYIGSSAGSMICASDINCSYIPYIEEELKDFGGLNLSDYRGLGLVDFMVFPHWGHPDSEASYFDYRLKHAYKEENKIILLTNNQYVRVVGDMYRIEEVEK